MLLAILAWSSAILGLFITYNLVVPPSLPPTHNLACYLTPHAINHTQQLYQRIAAVRNIVQRSIPPPSLSPIDQSTLDKQLVTVAQSFQKYVQQITESQSVRRKDIRIQTAIKEAEQSFLECKQSIEGSFDSKKCLLTWNSYLNCFQEVKKAQSHLSSLFTNEQQLQTLIQAQMTQPHISPQEKPEFKAQLIYNESIRNNEQALNNLRGRIFEAESKLSQSKIKKGATEDRLESKQRTYQDCWQNRRIYKHCEEISEQVKNISSGLLEQLKLQLQAKTRLMQEMREMMIRMGKGENRKMPQHWNEMYKKHKEEYKQMYLDYIYNTQKEGKACGCSEQEQKQLLSEVNKEKDIISFYNQEINTYNELIAKLRSNILEKEQERQRIISEYQNELKQYETIEPEKRQTQLIKLKKKLENNREEIVKVKDQFNRINQQCSKVKSELTLSLKDISKVEDCLSKKDYMLKLRAETAKYLSPDFSLDKLLQSKKELADALSAIGQQ